MKRLSKFDKAWNKESKRQERLKLAIANKNFIYNADYTELLLREINKYSKTPFNIAYSMLKSYDSEEKEHIIFKGYGLFDKNTKIIRKINCTKIKYKELIQALFTILYEVERAYFEKAYPKKEEVKEYIINKKIETRKLKQIKRKELKSVSMPLNELLFSSKEIELIPLY